MDAATFEVLFAQHVFEPCEPLGWERWGKSMWFQRDGLRAALLRTEARHTWPFELTFVLGFDVLRDFEDRQPAPRSREPSEYPVKLAPLDLARRRYRYHPYNLGRWPSDVMRDGHVPGQLAEIGRTLANATPGLAKRFDPEQLQRQIRRRGEDAWCERRWIADLSTPRSSG